MDEWIGGLMDKWLKGIEKLSIENCKLSDSDLEGEMGYWYALKQPVSYFHLITWRDMLH
jgi:hypothetical protein